MRGAMYQTYGVKVSEKGSYQWTESIESGTKRLAAMDRKSVLMRDGITRAITYANGKLYRIEQKAGR